VSLSENRRVPVTIRRDGKPDKDGYITLDYNGLVEVYTVGRLNRLHIVRDPRKHEMFVDRASLEVVVDSRGFSVKPDDLDSAEQLLAAGLAQRGPHREDRRLDGSGGTTSSPAPAAASLATWSSALVVVASVLGVLGIVGGMMVALQTDDTGFDTEYPYVFVGLGIAANAAFVALIGVVLGKLGQVYASIAARSND
jgi:hypothetical protein